MGDYVLVSGDGVLVFPVLIAIRGEAENRRQHVGNV